MSNNELIVSLDIGTTSVKVMIGEIINESLSIIGVGHAKSEGIKKGSIVNIDKTVHTIKKAIEQAERIIGSKIKRVVVGISGNHVQLHECHGVVAVQSPKREISDQDIARVIEQAQVVSLPPEQEIIDIVPRQFIVDGQDEIKDPRDMAGVRLEMEGTLITCSKTILHNVLRCVERAGLIVADVCLLPLAMSDVALSQDEKQLGVVLVDIGGGQTTVSVFQDGDIEATIVLPVGGEHITKDISIVLRTSMEDAERIKVNHGCAYLDLASEDEVFSVPILGSDQHQQFNQYEISEIIEARLEEMLEMVQNEVRKLGIHEVASGYVLSGGVSAMAGVADLAEEVFGHHVRLAIPDFIGVRHPKFMAGIGLISFAYKNAELFERSIGIDGTDDHEDDVEESYHDEKPVAKPKQKPKGEEGTSVTNRMKKIFTSFFE